MTHYEELAPNVTDIEATFLSAMFITPDLVVQYADRLKPGDFFLTRNAWVWEAMCALAERGEGIDNATVSEELKRGGRLTEIGGPTYILKIMTTPGVALYADSYANLILRAAFRRKALAVASDLAKCAYNMDMTEEDLMVRLETLSARLRQAMPGDDGYHVGERAQLDYEDIINARLQDSVPDNFAVHLEALEHHVPAIKPGKMVVISGLSGHGKTILMEEWAEWLAMLGNRVLYITTELTAEDHLDRRYVRHAGLSYARIIAPTDDVRARIHELRERLGAWQHNLDFWEVSEPGYERVIAQMRRAHQHGRRAFFVDYFWEILEDDQRLTIDRAVKALHAFAKTTGSLVVVGSQVSETEQGLRIYGTRRLNHKAALHLQLQPSEKAKVTETYRLGERIIEVEPGGRLPWKTVRIEKNTFGPEGVEIKLFMDGARFRFVDESQVAYGLPPAPRNAAQAAPKFLGDEEVWRGG